MKKTWLKRCFGTITELTKGNLKIKWDLYKRRYEIYRNEERVEFGSTPHYPLERFLEYAEMAWANH